MPILNSVYSKKLFVSEFFCPCCFVIRPYSLKPMSERVTFYPIPSLGSNKAHDVIECQVCKNAFDLDILNRNNQSLFKLVLAARDQLDQGICPGYLKLRLISDGLQESFVTQLITLAQH